MMFDFVEDLNNFMKKQIDPNRSVMINRYITGKITKQQLDEFMKKLAPKD